MGKGKATLLDYKGNVIEGAMTEEAVMAMERADERLIQELFTANALSDKWLYLFRGDEGKPNFGLTVHGTKALFERTYKRPGKVIQSMRHDRPDPDVEKAVVICQGMTFATPDGSSSTTRWVDQPEWTRPNKAGQRFRDWFAAQKASGKVQRNCERALLPFGSLARFQAECLKFHSKRVEVLGMQDAQEKGDPMAEGHRKRIFGIADQAWDRKAGEQTPNEKVRAFIAQTEGKRISEMTGPEAQKAADNFYAFYQKSGREAFRKAIEAMEVKS